MADLERSTILPEAELPAGAELLAEGSRLAQTFTVGRCPFLTTYDVPSESEYKRRRMAERALMFHAQFGFRSPEKSRRAYAEIWERVAVAGYRVDRYGICLDWSMGYPAERRPGMPHGTGLILESPEAFAALTQGAPVAPHFGDFVIGMPAAVENTAAALAAGSTVIGNLGQYFTFKLPRWDDDVGTTAETVKALAMCAGQSEEVLIHSNLDDGFASMFTDLACSVGTVLIERAIVEDLVGGCVSHCYGHTFSDPLSRWAFQKALARVTDTPGSMVYGNTTIFVAEQVENYANLASYLLVDLVAQHVEPTGHALNPVPVTEALRIPEIDEIVDAHLFANRLALRSGGFETLVDPARADEMADRLVDGGWRFKQRVLEGLAEAGIDTEDPFELLLALRRLGARRLEALWGPGEAQEGAPRGRVPVVKATTVAALESQGEGVVAALEETDRKEIGRAHLTACVTSTDVHEYGKILVEAVLGQLGVEVVDAGVSADPEEVAERACGSASDLVAVSTYSGIALRYLTELKEAMDRLGCDMPIFVGGKLNEVPEGSPSSLPEDVTRQLEELGAVVCLRVEDMLRRLVQIAKEANVA
jgi:methylmalonyl-CoA mutase cobalamin-binding domain/chain